MTKAAHVKIIYPGDQPEQSQFEKEIRNRHQTPEDAAHLVAGAAVHRAIADKIGHADPTGARLSRIEADQMDRVAGDILDPSRYSPDGLQVGAGGEVVPLGPAAQSAPVLVDTVNDKPDMLAANASFDRLNLVSKVGASNLALDAAETMGRQNSLEKMLAHQMAAAHKVGMQMMARAQHFMDLCHSGSGLQAQQVANVEAARAASAAARMFDSYQQAMMTAQRFRSGGKQKIVVQHVNVQEGGQAVVAGDMRTGGRSRRRGGEP